MARKDRCECLGRRCARRISVGRPSASSVIGRSRWRRVRPRTATPWSCVTAMERAARRCRRCLSCRSSMSAARHCARPAAASGCAAAICVTVPRVAAARGLDRVGSQRLAPARHGDGSFGRPWRTSGKSRKPVRSHRRRLRSDSRDRQAAPRLQPRSRRFSLASSNSPNFCMAMNGSVTSGAVRHPNMFIAGSVVSRTARIAMQAARCGDRAGISGSFCESLATDRPHMRRLELARASQARDRFCSVVKQPATTTA